MTIVAAVVAHPDDESYPFAATLARCVERGFEVRVICLSRGDAGVDRGGSLRGAALGQRRSEEFEASCAVLGATPRVLDFPDAHLEEHEEEMVAALEELLADVDVVLTLGEDGGYGHRDHLACTRAVARAIERAGSCSLLHAAFPRGLFAPIHRALRRYVSLRLDAHALGTEREAVDHVIDARPYRVQKLASVGAHVSQLDAGDPMSFLEFGPKRTWLEPLLREEWLVHVRGPEVELGPLTE